jgi:hypothetical protein
MLPRAVLVALLLITPALAESPADKWEKALLEMKQKGTLPGPKPGQKCLWSERLKACLWYTPGKWLK